ncbi:MAG: hypothetical protein ACPGVD_05015 [Flavobacteriales bacterium]
MKKIVLILLGLSLFYFCKKASETETPHYVEITNNSSHSIIIEGYDGDSDIEIDSNEVYSFSYITKGNTERNKGFMEGFKDSTKLTYDSTTYIYHGSTRYSAARDIRQAKYYIYQNTNNQAVHYYFYTLTNDDYDEAVMISDSL